MRIVMENQCYLRPITFAGNLFSPRENESLHCISVQIRPDTKLMAYYVTDDVESFSLP